MSESTVEATPRSEKRRLTVRLPEPLYEDLDTLVEEGHFIHTSEVVRTAIRRIVTDSDIRARSLDVRLLRRIVEEPDATVDFTTHDMADALDVTPQQLGQSIRAHQQLADPLVDIEQWPDDATPETVWRATPRLSVGGSPEEQSSLDGGEC